MHELEEKLRSLEPKEPSADFYQKGLERLDQVASEPPAAFRWQSLAVVATCLFVLSAALNILLLVRQPESDPAVARMLMTQSSLIVSGDAFIGEQHYEPVQIGGD